MGIDAEVAPLSPCIELKTTSSSAPGTPHPACPLMGGSMGAWALDRGKLLAGVGGHDNSNVLGIATHPEGDVVIFPLTLHLHHLGESLKYPRLGGGDAPALFSS